MSFISPAAVAGVVRALIAAGGGYLIGLGILDEETVAAIAGAAATIVTAIWSVYSKRHG